MYQVPTVLTALSGRVGWRQPTQADAVVLTDANKESKSGRYFQDEHAAVLVENIYDAQADRNISDADFNTFLANLSKAAITKTMDAVFHSMEVVDSMKLYEPECNIVNQPIPNVAGQFVGFQIQVGPVPDYTTIVDNVALYFDSEKTFNLYCFVDRNPEPIWTKSVTTVANKEVLVPIGDLSLGYLGSVNRVSTYYIGYFQSDLEATKAINTGVLYNLRGCLWQVEPFTTAKVGNAIQFPIQGSGFTYGLNFQLTSHRDHTTRIVMNAPLFDNAVSLQMACSVIELLLSNTRSNITERITKEQMGELYLQLNQEQGTVDRPFGPGLKAKYQREIEKLHKSFFGQPKIETHSLPYEVYSNHGHRY